jgi:AcrR family transcriptional regulator
MTVVIDDLDSIAAQRSAQEIAVVDATLSCLARYGLAKTTLADVASEAKVSRATIYRWFPSRESLFNAVLAVEYRRFTDHVEQAISRSTDLAELIARSLHAGVGYVASHQALGHVLAHEPDRVLPLLALDQGDFVLEAGARVLRGPLQVYLAADDADWVALWIARLGLTYLLGTDDSQDLATVAKCRRLVIAFVLPGISDLQLDREGDRSNLL